MKEIDSGMMQQRIDELHLLSEQANFRINKLAQQHTAFMEGSQTLFADVATKAEKIAQSTSQLTWAGKQIEEDLNLSQCRVAYSIKIFVTAVVTFVVSIIMILGIALYYGNRIADSKNELQELTVKLRHKSVVFHHQDQDYIRIVPGSVVKLVENNSRFKGTFAAVKYAE